MPYQKRQLEGEVAINGLKLRWHLLREQQWCTADGWKGPAVKVVAAEGHARALILQYPSKRLTSNLNRPSHERWMRPDFQYKPVFHPLRIEADIQEALSAGWDPHSRGKVRVIELKHGPEGA